MTINRRARLDKTSDGTAARLAERLARLATDPARLATEQRLSSDADQRLHEVLREIDETLLPRRLQLGRGGRDLACLTVVHRHLVAIDLPTRPGAVAAAGVPPEGFARSLAELLRPEGDYRISRHRASAAAGAGNGSLSADTLRRQIEGGPGQGPLEALSQHLAPIARARMDWADRTSAVRFDGDPDWSERLADLGDRFRFIGQASPPNARITRSGVEGLLLPISAEMIVVLAGLGDRGFAAILPRGPGLAALADWQQGLKV